MITDLTSGTFVNNISQCIMSDALEEVCGGDGQGCDNESNGVLAIFFSTLSLHLSEN